MACFSQRLVAAEAGMPRGIDNLGSEADDRLDTYDLGEQRPYQGTTVEHRRQEGRTNPCAQKETAPERQNQTAVRGG